MSGKFLSFLYSVSMLLILYSCSTQNNELFENGVSKQLAAERKSTLSDIIYNIHFDIPEQLKQEINGKVSIKFQINNISKPIILDFNESPDKIVSVKKDGKDIKYSFLNEHIIIPQTELKIGSNSIDINFIAGETSLNRNKEFLYTLFVPDRASFAFPCFDQPNLKAKFNLSLTIPKTWIAVSNGKTITNVIKNNVKFYKFEETQLLSTYLFSFAAGKFQIIEKEIFGYKMNMFHRETDQNKLKNNVEDIFNLHANALKWLENYTNIKYPFDKFDFIIIPSFQYSGMEHPGAILYRDSKLFLDKKPNTTELLTRASLISHETAHIWFGDFVTMDWFDDVWLKEVFANFMAAKIANPTFPNVNHKLRFLMAHFPEAYSVDRTKGANPIKQKLDNLKFAGTLYGAIIYKKSPIVMQQLENIIGAKEFKKGVNEYLNNFKYGNADWSDLISILNKRTDEDLNKWSNVWINKSGRPTISYNYNIMDNKISNFTIHQKDPSENKKNWNQPLSVLYSKNNKIEFYNTYLNSPIISIPELDGKEKPDFILVNSSGLEYGNFILDQTSTDYLLKNISEIKDEELRGIIWLTLYDNLLEKNIDVINFSNSIITAIKSEKNQQNLNLIITIFKNVFWNLIDKNNQKLFADKLEKKLIQLLNSKTTSSYKKIYFNAYKDFAYSKSAENNLYKFWCDELDFTNLKLSEKDKINLSLELAVREHPKAIQLLSDQLDNIKSNDERNKYIFLMPFVSSIEKIRDNIFSSLKDVRNRAQEPWVVEALYYLHHPYKRDYATKYLKESLELVEEIQETGDIFFPKRWLDSTFKYHNSKKAVRIVKDFFEKNPDYNFRLKNKILQSTDMLFRSTSK